MKLLKKKQGSGENNGNSKVADIERKKQKDRNQTARMPPSRRDHVVMRNLLHVNRFVPRHICLLCTPTYACAYTSGMAFARAGWCLSSYYKFMAVGEANADQPRIYEMKREHPYRTERRLERILRGERVNAVASNQLLIKSRLFLRSVGSAVLYIT